MTNSCQDGIKAITNGYLFQNTTEIRNLAISPVSTVAISDRPNRIKKSLSSFIKEQEDTNPEFKEKMYQARKRLAGEFGDEFVNGLAKLRMEKGFSQTELAELIGTSQSHIAKIEAKKIDVKFSTAVRIADALNVTIDVLRPYLWITTPDKKSKNITWE